jgi:hypothetical protein
LPVTICSRASVSRAGQPTALRSLGLVATRSCYPSP